MEMTNYTNVDSKEVPIIKTTLSQSFKGDTPRVRPGGIELKVQDLRKIFVKFETL